MSAPQPAGAAGRSLDSSTLILIGVLGTVLVAGYVVLAALGRDTTGYLLFLGGPAVTTLVGALLNRRVSNVQEHVSTVTAETKALVSDSVSDLDNHLTEQDEAIAAAATDARVARVAIAGATDRVPPARTQPASDLFGPIRAGLVRRDQE